MYKILQNAKVVEKGKDFYIPLFITYYTDKFNRDMETQSIMFPIYAKGNINVFSFVEKKLPPENNKVYKMSAYINGELIMFRDTPGFISAWLYHYRCRKENYTAMRMYVNGCEPSDWVKNDGSSSNIDINALFEAPKPYTPWDDFETPEPYNSWDIRTTEPHDSWDIT